MSFEHCSSNLSTKIKTTTSRDNDTLIRVFAPKYPLYPVGSDSLSLTANPANHRLWKLPDQCPALQ